MSMERKTKTGKRNYRKALCTVFAMVILALLGTCLPISGLTKVKAEEETTATVTAPNAVTASFKWETNSLEADTAAYVYVLKAKTGNTIKVGTAAVQMTKAAGAEKASVTLEELGIKKAKNDIYLYVCDKEFEAEGSSISANFEIKASAAKKITAKIDYTKADGEELNVITVTVIDTSGKEVSNPVIYWSTEAKGTYFEANDDETSTTRKYSEGTEFAPNGFDGRTLKEMLAGGSTIYIKVKGVDGASGTAQLSSLPVKVKIPKQGKAPNAKIDVKKDTISIKNGFDFGYTTKEKDGSYGDICWFTILPNLSGAQIKEAEASIVPTTHYIPLDKKDKNAGKEVTVQDGEDSVKKFSYTDYKFKSLSIDTLLSEAGEPEDGYYYIAIRKSATDKKPASAIQYIDLKVQAGMPLVYTQENVKDEFLVATSTDLKKNPLKIGTILPNPGSISGESISGAATDGYAESFRVITSISGGTIVDADEDGSSFEYVVVNQKDLDATGNKAIDMSTLSWKKLDPAKTKFTEKLKGKYKLKDGTSVSAEIKMESGQAENGIAKTYILVRRAGIKASSIRASEYIKLYMAKQGKTYSLYSTVDNGARAYKYRIKFVKYQETAGTGEEEKSYAWGLTDAVEPIAVWLAPGDTKYVTLPKVENAKLFNAEIGEDEGKTIYELANAESGEVTLEDDAEHKGKYMISSDAGTSDEIVEYIAVRELANVKIVAEITDSVSGSATAGSKETKTLVTIINGKSSISGDDTIYYVGEDVTLENIADPTTTKENCTIEISEDMPEEANVDVDDGTTGTHTYGFAINKAEEMVITIPFVLKDQETNNQNQGGSEEPGEPQAPEPTKYTVTFTTPQITEKVTGRSYKFNVSEVKASGNEISSGMQVISETKITVKLLYTWSAGRDEIEELYVNGFKAEYKSRSGSGQYTDTYSVDIIITKSISLEITGIKFKGGSMHAN